MKKIIKKLFIFLFAIILIFSFSGCYWRYLEKFIQGMEKNQKTADGFEIQCLDYSLEVFPVVCEKGKVEEYRIFERGFKSCPDFFDEYEVKGFTVTKSEDDSHIKIQLKANESGISDRAVVISKQEIVGYELCFRPEKRTFAGVTALIVYDGVYFLITACGDLSPATLPYQEYNPTPFAPALYLVDFENNKLLYCGYAKGYYDCHKNGITDDLYVGDSHLDFYFKIEKNAEVWNDE